MKGAIVFFFIKTPWRAPFAPSNYDSLFTFSGQLRFSQRVTFCFAGPIPRVSRMCLAITGFRGRYRYPMSGKRSVIAASCPGNFMYQADGTARDKSVVVRQPFSAPKKLTISNLRDMEPVDGSVDDSHSLCKLSSLETIHSASASRKKTYLLKLGSVFGVSSRLCAIFRATIACC
jgi:hypothetical protein